MSALPGNQSVTIMNLPYVKVMTKFGAESRTLMVGALKVLGKAMSIMQLKLVRGVKAAGFAQLMSKLYSVAAFSVGGDSKMRERLAGACYFSDCSPIRTPMGCLYDT